MLEYGEVEEAVFITRKNRFIASVELNGKTEDVHVKNTGRLKELLIPGCRSYVVRSSNGKRRTAYDLIAVETYHGVVNIDSMAPNEIAGDIFRTIYPGISFIRREVAYSDSRFDYYFESEGRRAFAEVKGCTLLEGDTALFPDARTARGGKHLEGLIRAREEGYEAAVLFVCTMKGAKRFSPNREADPEFADALEKASLKGVRIYAYDCVVTPGSLMHDKALELKLKQDVYQQSK